MATTVASARFQPEAPTEAKAIESVRHLHGPVTDFLLLGGLSFLVLPVMLLLPVDGYQGYVAFWALLLANVINHPHFAHSYQIFYRGYRSKLSSTERPLSLRIRYAVARILVPIVLAAFFLFGIATKDVRLVGLGGNVMALFVGWHYVKQGYGMLMVDAVLKRRFFSDQEKKVMLINAYAVWITAWLFFNQEASRNELWGLQYFSFAVPALILDVAMAAVVLSTGAVTLTLMQRYRAGKKLPVTGVIAYAVTLYLWTLFARINPLWLLVIPALHSIQYLAVVYRFQTNLAKANAAQRSGGGTWRSALNGHRVRLTLFAATGLLIGAALFWGLPAFFDARIAYESKIFGPTLFLFLFWVTVNVHHYFLDSVMWRRDNPETKLHLFS
jgi:hypothetical protein